MIKTTAEILDEMKTESIVRKDHKKLIKALEFAIETIKKAEFVIAHSVADIHYPKRDLDIAEQKLGDVLNARDVIETILKG